jgi:hypothetical protein
VTCSAPRSYFVWLLDNLTPSCFVNITSLVQALVVMVGHPTAVSRDQHWGSWLNFCIHHKSYYGCSSPSKHHSPLLSELGPTETCTCVAEVPHELSQRGSMDDAAQQAARRVLGQARGNPWAQAFESSEQMQQFHGGETNFRDIM